jgi:hypothetical protein
VFGKNGLDFFYVFSTATDWFREKRPWFDAPGLGLSNHGLLMKNGPAVVEIFSKPCGLSKIAFLIFAGPGKKKVFFFFPIFSATAGCFGKKRPPFDGPGLGRSDGGLLFVIGPVAAEIFANTFRVLKSEKNFAADS